MSVNNNNPFSNSQVLSSLLKIVDTSKNTPDTISVKDVKQFLDRFKPVIKQAPGFDSLSQALNMLAQAGGADMELPTAALGLVLAGSPPEASEIRQNIKDRQPRRSILDMPEATQDANLIPTPAPTPTPTPAPVTTPAGETYLVAEGDKWSLDKSKAKIQATFAEFDADKNGQLDAAEFQKYTDAKFGSLSKEQFNGLFDTINGLDEGVKTAGYDQKVSTVSLRELGNFLYYADGQGDARVGQADGTVSKEEALSVIPPKVANETPLDRINARTEMYNLLETTGTGSEGTGVVKKMLGDNAEAAESLKASTDKPLQNLIELQNFTKPKQDKLIALMRKELLAKEKEVKGEALTPAETLSAEEKVILTGYRAARALDTSANPAGEKRSWDNGRFGYLTNEAGVSQELSGGLANRSYPFQPDVKQFLTFLNTPEVAVTP